ncbi:MAG: CinA family protein [Chloroflexi bacterium]|nr:CinA family protein [Chloroflexota bacterium]
MELEKLAKTLTERGLTVVVAEADTAGYVGHLLCSVPGASRYFPGGVIAYGRQPKTHVLGVREETLRRHGSVSRETALEMAEGVRRLMDADIGISTTGVAGPTGGSPEKPVGTFWIALSARDGTQRAQEHRFGSGERMANKEKAAHAAVRLLAGYLGLD